MTFFCENCNYTTHRKHDWEKHRKTAKHQNNTIKQLVCNKCNKQLNSKTTFYNHIKICNKTENNNLSKKDFELELLKLKHDFDQKEIERLNILLQHTTKTTEKALKITDKTISAIKYANEHFKNAPILTPIENYNLLNYDLDDNNNNDNNNNNNNNDNNNNNIEDKKLVIETLLYHYRKNSVHRVFGDHIVSIYKKANLADQCMHTTDTSRMNYIIKISKDENNNSKWITDKNGVVICDVIIEKLINHYVNLLKWYQKKLLDELSLNPGIVQPDKQQKVENILGMLMDVDNGSLIKNTNRYIAPFFNLDK